MQFDALDFFIWDYMKSLVYTDKPASIANIERVIGQIPVEMCEKVAHNWCFQLDHLKRSRRPYLHEIIILKKFSCQFASFLCFSLNLKTKR